jgi:hypothetical protein
MSSNNEYSNKRKYTPALYEALYEKTLLYILLRSPSFESRIEEERLNKIKEILRKGISPKEKNKIFQDIIEKIKNAPKIEKDKKIYEFIENKINNYLDEILNGKIYTKSLELNKFINYSLRKNYTNKLEVNFIIITHLFNKLKRIEYDNTYNDEKEKTKDLNRVYNIILNNKNILPISDFDAIKIVNYFLARLDIISLMNNILIIDKIINENKLNNKINKNYIKISTDCLLRSVRWAIEDKERLIKEAETIFNLRLNNNDYNLDYNNIKDLYLNDNNTIAHSLFELKNKKLDIGVLLEKIMLSQAIKDAKDIINDNSKVLNTIVEFMIISNVYDYKFSKIINDYNYKDKILDGLVKTLEKEDFKTFALISEIIFSQNIIEIDPNKIKEEIRFILFSYDEFYNIFSELIISKINKYINYINETKETLNNNLFNVNYYNKNIDDILNKSYDLFFYLIPFLNFHNFNFYNKIDLEDPEFRKNLLYIISKYKEYNSNPKIKELEKLLSDNQLYYNNINYNENITDI